MDKINEWQKAIKLTNPKTHIVNFSSTLPWVYNAISRSWRTWQWMRWADAGQAPDDLFGRTPGWLEGGLAARTGAVEKMIKAFKTETDEMRAWEHRSKCGGHQGKFGKAVRLPSECSTLPTSISTQLTTIRALGRRSMPRSVNLG